MSIVTHCRVCGREFEPDRQRIIAGDWQTCDACRSHWSTNPLSRPMAGQCRRCGRPLRDRDRTLCLPCLGVSTS